MRIALIADIHGNLVALETVLQELSSEPIDQFICLGDVGSLGPQPHEVLDRLRRLRYPVLLGNTDAWLLKPPTVEEKDSENLRIMYAINAWNVEQLTFEDRTYLQTFPPLLELSLDEKNTLLCYHGSPSSFDDVIAATTPAVDVKRMLAGYFATSMVGGHTHIQMIRSYEDARIINVGSIGLPGVNAGSPELPMNHDVHWAEYGILSVEGGRLSIDLRRTPLNMEAVLRAATDAGMPHLEWWMQKWERR
jgi:predicted phosphodiesterase